jgi:hypothetical protein
MKTCSSILFLVLFSMISTTPSQGQSKPSVTVSPFTFNHSRVGSASAEIISREVEGIISACGRLDVVNREHRQLINAEKEVQKTEDFIDGKVVEQGASLGAEMIVVGHILSDASSSEGIAIQLSLIDIATTQIKISEVITTNARSQANLNSFSNDLKSLTSYKTDNQIQTGLTLLKIVKEVTTNNTLEHHIKEFINDHFPLRIGIAQIDQVEKDEVKTLLIFASKGNGLSKGSKLNVVESSTIKNPNGTTGKREVTISEVAIEKFEGDYALCKVIKGGDQLLQKKDNKNVYLVSKTK